MQHPVHSWVPAALLAAVCFAAINLIIKVLNDSGVPAPLVVGGMFGSAALFALPFFWTKRRHSSARGVFAILGVGVLAYIANIFQVRSIAQAPHPGLPPAIIGTQVLIVTIISCLVFRSPFSWHKGFGLCLVIAGIVCISTQG